jgi:type I restriction enzyme S subunit
MEKKPATPVTSATAATPSPQPRTQPPLASSLNGRGAKNVPALRFPEFTGKYFSAKIRDVAKLASGTTPLRSNPAYFIGGHIPWVKTTDLNNSIILQTEEKITDLALKETSLKIFPSGSVLVAMYGGFNQIGRTGMLINGAATNQALSVIQPQKKLLNSFYLLMWMNRSINLWRRFAASSRKDPNITSSDVAVFPMVFPSLEEQQKVADFLTAVDAKIQQLKRERELMQQYKKGVMQQLFSQQVRFKDDDGRDYPDWEEDEFGKFVTNKSSKYDPNKEIADFICIELDSLGQETGVLLQTYSSREQASIKSKFKKGNVLFGKLRPYLKKYWMASFDGVCSTEIWVLDGKKIQNDFLFYLIQTHEFQEIANVSSGSKMPRSDWNFVSSYLMAYPCLKEQGKIAGFLAAIDAKIQQVSAQVAQAEAFKKGLLQQMFV